jgi:hypothetical protein
LVKGGEGMDNYKIKLFLKFVLFGVIWALISAGIGLLISEFMDYNFRDIFFVEGMLLIMIGIFSSIGGKLTGLPLQLKSSNAQYVSNAYLQMKDIEKKEKKNNSDVRKANISIGISGIALIVGGLICMIINFVI